MSKFSDLMHNQFFPMSKAKPDPTHCFCGKPALYRADGYGFCRAHKGEAQDRLRALERAAGSAMSTMAPPKPEKTGPKPRKRIKRGGPIARTSRPAKVRKTPRSKLKRQADKLWSLIVRAAGKCRICGSADRLQAAHGFSRRYLGTRHSLINGWCLCSGCHMRYTHDPLGWDQFMRTELGSLYEPLRFQALARCVPDYDAVIHTLNLNFGGQP